MGPAPSRLRNENQEQVTRTVANKDNNENGSTNDPDPKFTGSVGFEGGQGSTKVSTMENRVDIPGHPTHKFIVYK